MNPFFVFSGGGTGGHLYPALSVLDEVARFCPEAQFKWVGAKGRLEETVIPQRGIPIECLELQGMDRGKSGFARLQSGLCSAGILGRAALSLACEWASCPPAGLVVSGAYIGVPAAMAAIMLRIPLFVMEQNSLPGLSNRMLAPFATRVFAGLPLRADAFSSLARVEYTGNPVRRELIELRKLRLADGNGLKESRLQAAQALGLSDFFEKSIDSGSVNESVTCVVMGGSLGSNLMVDLLEETLETGALRSENTRFILLSGSHGRALKNSDRLISLPFTDRMDLVYTLADFAIVRAGATTIAEVAALGMPSMIIPWKGAAEGHQAINASLLKGTSCRIMDEEIMTSTEFSRVFNEVAQGALNRQCIEQIAVRGRPDAARDIALQILKLTCKN